jgi:hypothetical protein
MSLMPNKLGYYLCSVKLEVVTKMYTT